MLRTALIRGAFDYQGQKCSAASRAFVPRSVWQQMGDDFLAATEALRYGDVTDLTNFGGAVIDERSFAKNVKAIERAKSAAGRDRRGRRRIRRQRRLFRAADGAAVRRPDRRGVPHRVLRADPVGARLPRRRTTTDILDVVDTGAKYALTGAVIADDRAAVLAAQQRLRYAAGNFYVNDKPTGAVVGQQPFGGSRASGTNDKAGSPLNLLRWTSARSIKETFVPPTDHTYPHMEAQTDGCVFDKSLGPRSWPPPVATGLRRTAERLPVTRTGGATASCPVRRCPRRWTPLPQLRDSGRFVTIDYLGEDTTDVDAADATVRAYLDLLDALGTARRGGRRPACGRSRCR